jgi:hypothetical protein
MVPVNVDHFGYSRPLQSEAKNEVPERLQERINKGAFYNPSKLPYPNLFLLSTSTIGLVPSSTYPFSV